MARLIARRLAAGVVIVWLVSVLVFLATQLLPGDAASELLGRQGTPEAVAALQKQLHLNDPVFAQYWHWLRDLVTGQWGNSLVSQDSVAHIVGTGIENTGLVMLLTMLVATPIAVWLGVVSALHSEGWLDHVLSVVTLVLVALPAFVIALVLIFLFATNVTHVLPAASLVNPDESIFSQLNLVVLPTATLALAVIPYPLRMVRQAMVEVLDSEYVSLARLHGLSRRRVIFRHALPNAVATTIQASALNLVFLAGGVVVVETVFSYPGLGRALEQAVSQRDIPLVQTIVVLLAVFYVIVNLVADVLVVLVTPRLRVSGGDAPETVVDAMAVAAEPLA
jgi:peptide/nickel transport system permease protein